MTTPFNLNRVMNNAADLKDVHICRGKGGEIGIAFESETGLHVGMVMSLKAANSMHYTLGNVIRDAAMDGFLDAHGINKDDITNIKEDDSK